VLEPTTRRCQALMLRSPSVCSSSSTEQANAYPPQNTGASNMVWLRVSRLDAISDAGGILQGRLFPLVIFPECYRTSAGSQSTQHRQSCATVKSLPPPLPVVDRLRQNSSVHPWRPGSPRQCPVHAKLSSCNSSRSGCALRDGKGPATTQGLRRV